MPEPCNILQNTWLLILSGRLCGFQGVKNTEFSRYHRKITHLTQRHVANEEVRAKVQQAVGPHEDLFTNVKRRKLKWYGHVFRSSGLAETIVQGTVKGWRRQGRQKKKWEDNIREWTGLEFAESRRAVENREKWRKLVLKSFVVPQLPPRLREGKRYVSWGSSPFSTGFARLNLFSLDFSLCKCHSGRSSGNTTKGNNSRSSSSSGSSSSRCCCYSSSSE